MFARFFQSIFNHGVSKTMDMYLVNRIRRINVAWFILFILILFSICFGALSSNYVSVVRDSIMLVLTLSVTIFVPVGKKTQLNSTLLMAILYVGFASAYIIEHSMSPPLILALYLLFPLAAASIMGRQAVYISALLAVTLVLLNILASEISYVHLGLFDTIVFYMVYILMTFASTFIEKTTRIMYSNMKVSRMKMEDQIVQQDEFISRLSHKLRTSLGNLTLINNLVHDGRLNSEQQELMETLRASTNTLVEDVNQLVEIASPGNLDYKKSIIPFDLAQVLRESLDILTSGNDNRNGIEIRNMAPMSHLLIGDPSLVRSLIVNIFRSLEAYRFEDRPISLELDILNEQPGQIRLKFTFSTRSPLAGEMIRQVDDLKRGVSQPPSSLSNAFHLLAESECELNATEDNGNLYLGFFQDFTKDLTREIRPNQEITPGRAGRKGVALNDAKVLLVEDNEINQKIVLLSLNRRVREIDVAANGKEALELFGSKQYDMILMDIMMPVMDGLTATKKIREIESTNESHTPIITITANALAGDRDNCLAAGADDYIAKPFQAEVLIKKMKNLLA